MKTPEIEGILTLNIRIDTLLIENQQKEIKQLTEQLAASRAEAAQWKTELVKSSDEISQALERGWLNPVAAKNLTADLAAKERECERLRELYRAERSKMGAWFRHKAETEANIKAAAGGVPQDTIDSIAILRAWNEETLAAAGGEGKK